MKKIFGIVASLMLIFFTYSPVMASPIATESHLYLVNGFNKGSSSGSQLGLGMGYLSDQIFLGWEIFPMNNLETVDLNVNIYSRLPAKFLFGANIDMLDKNHFLPSVKIGLYREFILSQQFYLYLGGGISARLTDESSELDKFNGYFGEIQTKLNVSEKNFVYAGIVYNTIDDITGYELGTGISF